MNEDMLASVVVALNQSMRNLADAIRELAAELRKARCDDA